MPGDINFVLALAADHGSPILEQNTIYIYMDDGGAVALKKLSRCDLFSFNAQTRRVSRCCRNAAFTSFGDCIADRLLHTRRSNRSSGDSQLDTDSTTLELVCCFVHRLWYKLFATAPRQCVLTLCVWSTPLLQYFPSCAKDSAVTRHYLSPRDRSAIAVPAVQGDML